ncbi:hypothetical protein [Streptomyces phaeochromogenes]|uniref:hypothetical protein n=1 Tax=Streptomyces phaeochromogenes TaxID=1923 RepID=UPI0012FF1F89
MSHSTSWATCAGAGAIRLRSLLCPHCGHITYRSIPSPTTECITSRWCSPRPRALPRSAPAHRW